MRVKGSIQATTPGSSSPSNNKSIPFQATTLYDHLLPAQKPNHSRPPQPFHSRPWSNLQRPDEAGIDNPCCAVRQPAADIGCHWLLHRRSCVVVFHLRRLSWRAGFWRDHNRGGAGGRRGRSRAAYPGRSSGTGSGILPTVARRDGGWASRSRPGDDGTLVDLYPLKPLNPITRSLP